MPQCLEGDPYQEAAHQPFIAPTQQQIFHPQQQLQQQQQQQMYHPQQQLQQQQHHSEYSGIKII